MTKTATTERPLVFSQLYEVGRTYFVPIVTGYLAGKNVTVPVLGPEHEDAEHIRFPQQHYHVDARFLSNREFDRLSKGPYGPAEVYRHVLTSGRSLCDDLTMIGLRRRKCLRRWPVYPAGTPKWINALSAAYSHARMGANRICPHRGADLSTMVVTDGCVTCPLHGLKWNIATGRVVER